MFKVKFIHLMFCHHRRTPSKAPVLYCLFYLSSTCHNQGKLCNQKIVPTNHLLRTAHFWSRRHSEAKFAFEPINTSQNYARHQTGHTSFLCSGAKTNNCSLESLCANENCTFGRTSSLCTRFWLIGPFLRSRNCYTRIYCERINRNKFDYFQLFISSFR